MAIRNPRVLAGKRQAKQGQLSRRFILLPLAQPIIQASGMHFLVLVDGTPRQVELGFGSSKDLRAISRWRAPTQIKDQTSVRDAVEFARLASKRHSQYSTTLPTALSISQFQAAVTQQPRTEIALLFVVRASWFKRSSVIGIAQCRRTYCHHLVLEFLSVHPAIVGQAIAGQLQPRVSGVGKGLIYGLAEIANILGVELIWGEATVNSAPFYSHIFFGTTVKDHFFVKEQTLTRCGNEFREKFFGELD